ncbi:hypothetical protein SAMN04488503_2503 [Humidesulfovibrio mexicanus]|uniref:Uncharacterized protein n=1 Tax=Humidesulfovibrio mexicanus TaxID=147047 RepID=A0A239BE05_9BACT|nr:hypothetical protein [Humidesulfovibrio mexicanus]SNS06046.1 hypothetical protein SAMN04488503_2503 [Humidesulfovibrio mexicanus]
MQEISIERLHAILESEAVMDVIHDLGRNPAIKPVLADRAHEALQVAAELAENAKKDLSDEALTGIAIAAVRSIDPEQDEYHLHHVLVSWLGPDNVPNNQRFSWEPKGKPGKMNLATPPAFDPNKASMVGDPSAWREGLKNGPNVGRIEAIPDITPERSAELLQTQNTMAVADQAVMDMAPVSEALGRIKAAEFFRHVGDIIVAQTFVDLRNSKRYKDYPIKDAEGNLRRCQNFEEFCQLAFGKSYTRCYELSKNLHLLGPDLYESAERIGFKARDYAALKALPEAEQEIVKTALAAESKEQVLDILQDLAARHQSERAATKKQTEDMKADLDARDKLLADKSERLDKISMELEKLKSLPANKREVLRLEQEQAAAKKLTTAVMEAQAAVNAFLVQLAEIKEAEVSAYTKEHADHTASWFCQQVQYALQENGIQADMAEIMLPEWMRDQAKQSPVDQEGR